MTDKEKSEAPYRPEGTIKLTYVRRPDKLYNTSKIAGDISEITGFTKIDVQLVLKLYGKIAREKILSGYNVRMTGLFDAFRVVYPAKFTFLASYRGWLPAFFKAKIHFNRGLVKEMRKLTPSRKELDDSFEIK